MTTSSNCYNKFQWRWWWRKKSLLWWEAKSDNTYITYVCVQATNHSFLHQKSRSFRHERLPSIHGSTHSVSVCAVHTHHGLCTEDKCLWFPVRVVSPTVLGPDGRKWSRITATFCRCYHQTERFSGAADCMSVCMHVLLVSWCLCATCDCPRDTWLLLSNVVQPWLFTAAAGCWLIVLV